MRHILFLVHRIPYPPNRGDKIRSYHLLKHLARRHRVHLIAFADTDGRCHDAALTPLTASRVVHSRAKSRFGATLEALLSGKPASLTSFASGAMHRAVRELIAREPIDTIFVYSSQMAQYLPAMATQRIIMDFVDMDSAKFEGYAARGPVALRWLHAREATLLRRHEAAIAKRAHASLFVSDAEAGLFRERTGAPRVHVVENGIDTETYDPDAAFDTVDLAPSGIVFTGQMDYHPNIDAVRWFVQEVLPLVRRECPAAHFAIVGRNPTSAVTALGKRDGVRVVGEVADVRGWIAAADVVVAPLRIARGVQNKVLEAMAMGCPVVASVAAAEGIDHGGTIRVAALPRDFAQAVCALLADPVNADRLGMLGRDRVMRRYGWDARLASLDALIDPGPAA